MTKLVNIRTFGELATFRNGLNFGTSSRGKGELAVIGVGDFQQNERLSRFDHLERIARPSSLDDEALLRNGDLVFVRSNGNKRLIGRCMVLEGIAGQVTHSGFTIRARVTARDIEPEWIAQYFATGLARKAIMRRGGGTNISNLSQQILQDLPVPVPNPLYQTRVLRAAEQLTASLRLTTALLGTKRIFKRGLMQQLLTGQRRFPDFQGSAWKLSRLGDHVEEVTRRNERGTTVMLTASGEHGLVDQRRYFNRSVAGADTSRYFLLKKGEFAYNRSAMNGYPYGATKRLDDHDEGALSTLYLCFAIVDSHLDSDFLKHVFDSGLLNRQLRPIVRVGARAHGLLNVSDEEFLSISIPFPGNEEQRRIADVLNMIDREIDLLTAQQEQSKIYKRTLLSRLLFGELSRPAV